jgi:hypothetical protein
VHVGATLGQWATATVWHRRRGQSWLGGDESGAARSASQPGSTRAQGGNGGWAGYPGGLEPDYSGLGWYCRNGLGPRMN